MKLQSNNVNFWWSLGGGLLSIWLVGSNDIQAKTIGEKKRLRETLYYLIEA